MILYIGIFAFVLMIILGVFIVINEPKKTSISNWNTVVSAFVILMVISIFTIVPWAAISVSVNEIRRDNVSEYEELMLYKNSVEASNNEYLRWNYYEKVQEWNRRYDSAAEKETSFWFGPYQYDYFINTERIEFELRGDE